MAKILLVEDNELNSDMLRRRLTRRHHEVLLAEDGQQAVEIARSEQPALILMDMSLPVMDGWEATEIIKNDTTTQNIPVIALTAHATTADRARAEAVGCDAFEPKPVDLAALSKTIDALLGEAG
jgi:CheY-like chemotaxis protein